MRKWLKLAIAVMVILVLGIGGWIYSVILDQQSYINEVTAICSSLTNSSSQFAAYVAKVDDFSALKAKCEELQKDILSQSVILDTLGAKGVPSKFVAFHKNLQTLISGYSSFYQKLAVEATNWNKSSFEAVESQRNLIQDYQNSCYATWPFSFCPLKNDPGWCISLATDLKKLADSKKASISSSSIAATSGYLVVLPSVGSQFVYNPSVDYVSAMCQLLSGYKRLRGDLERAIQIYDSGGGISFEILNNAIQSRSNILSAIQSLNPPAEYIGAHSLAINTVNTGIAAVEAFRDRGDRQTLHNLSQVVNSNMAQLRRIYGF